ncbi:AgmX/PglI C-terminal domain-containing protein [Marinobacter apostichopi]|uniref:AgmX/PglI C-terminal domain-containing protein n=1 Tax=Marinobacter apostichopi TaxID=3035454 RepID=UPI00257323F2|nr:AgmX/PglI C-terminal domain-containing protein [Marinobacter sp. LA51]
MADPRHWSATSGELPWSSTAREDRQFAIVAALVAVIFLPVALWIPSLHVPEIERSEAEQVPPQLARLVERPKPIVAPEPKPPEPEPVTKEEPVPETQPKPNVAKPAPELAPKPEPVAVKRQTAEQAREKASRSGLLAMKDRLASLRAPAASEPEGLRANTSAEMAAQSVTPPSEVLQGSGGVTDSATPQAKVAVQGHRVKEVKNVAKGVSKVAKGEARQESSVGERAMSNIRKVFDAQKTALYSLYRRELRQDPTLEGKLLLELIIEPDGSVSACQVVSSELGNPPLEQRIAMRVRLFNFGADDVETRKVRFPIDFLPG